MKFSSLVGTKNIARGITLLSRTVTFHEVNICRRSNCLVEAIDLIMALQQKGAMRLNELCINEFSKKSFAVLEVVIIPTQPNLNSLFPTCLSVDTPTEDSDKYGNLVGKVYLTR